MPGSASHRLLALGALASGCAAADEVPPELLEGRFAASEGATLSDTIVLRFSEPIGPIADVDPAHFRISTALVIDDGAGGDLTIYYDLAHHFDDGLPGQDGASPALEGPWPRHSFTLVAGLERGEADDELILQLSYPLEPMVCAALAEAAALGIPHGIFVHYNEGSYPRITDEAGNALEGIGADWITEPFVATISGAFERLDPRIELECP